MTWRLLPWTKEMAIGRFPTNETAGRIIIGQGRDTGRWGQQNMRGFSAVRWRRIPLRTQGKLRSLAAGFIAVQLLLVGCTSSKVEEARANPTGIEPDEALSIIFLERFSLEGHALMRDEVVDCIGRSIRNTNPSLQIVPPEEFRRAAFPDLEPEAAPRSPDSIALLLTHPVFRERISALNIRYLIVVGGATEYPRRSGGIYCGGAGHGAGCLGLIVWDKETRLAASVIDLKRARPAGEVKATASGNPWFGVFLIFPIGLPAPTEASACYDLGVAITKFIAGEQKTEN